MQLMLRLTVSFILNLAVTTNSAIAQSARIAKSEQPSIRFIYPGDDNLRNLGAENHPLKFWTDCERTRVQEQFKKLTPQTSQFLHLNVNQSVQLGRVKGLIQGNKIALTTQNAILLSDEYFSATEPQANKTLLHELTHFSDCARYFSWSKPWIDYCETKNIVPNWSGINPYAEALAEFVSETLTTENPQADEVSFIGRLFSDSEKYQEWSQHIRLGLELKAIRNFKGAISRFKEAAQLAPNTLMPRLQLFYCYYHLSNTDKALAESDLAMKVIHKLQLKICAAELSEFLTRRYRWLLEKRSKAEADSFYAEVTRQCPEKIPLFKNVQRDVCVSKSKKLRPQCH